MRKRILVADDESSLRQRLGKQLGELGHEAVCVETGAEAIERLRREPFELCIAGLAMAAPDGFAVLAAARRRLPPVATIAMTSEGTAREAMAALRAGAFDFIARPFHPSAVEASVRRFLDSTGRSAQWQPTHGAALVGDHPAIRLVLERIDQVADSEASVLIRGEEGTGKQVAARLIHASSARRAGPFVSFHAAAVPAQLAETELLGGTRPFAEPARARVGKLLAADKGTLYLDEIAELSPALQGQLLDIVKSRQLRPSGSGEPLPIDVRFIASSSRPLEQLCRDGQFNQELYYRLNVIPIELPPLRARAEDIPFLIEHFRCELNASHGLAVPSFHLDVLDRMRTYEWPGNVRQLLNVVERLIVTAADRQVLVDDLPPNLRTSMLDLTQTPLDLPACGVDLRLLLAQLEDRLIGQALQRTGGNKNRAAELLGLNRTTLVEKLRRRNVA